MASTKVDLPEPISPVKQGVTAADVKGPDALVECAPVVDLEPPEPATREPVLAGAVPGPSG